MYDGIVELAEGSAAQQAFQHKAVSYLCEGHCIGQAPEALGYQQQRLAHGIAFVVEPAGGVASCGVGSIVKEVLDIPAYQQQAVGGSGAHGQEQKRQKRFHSRFIFVPQNRTFL